MSVASTKRASSLPDETAAKRVFDRPALYLRHDAHIPLRARLVAELVGDVSGRVLDVGCGDGRLSIPLLSTASELVLVDISPNMLEEASKNVPEQLRSRVRTRCSSLDGLEGEGPFDLVMCVGVLAHVPSVEAALSRLSGLTRPGGRCVLQISDVDHPTTRAYALASDLKRALRDSTGYQYQTVGRAELVRKAGAVGLELENERRHWALPPFAGVLPVGLCRRFLEAASDSPLTRPAGGELLLLFRKRAQGVERRPER